MDDTVIAAETPAEKTYFESKGTAEPPPVEQQVEQPADGQGEVEKPPQMVPHAALHEERVQRQRVTQELAKEREERAKLTGRFEVLERLARGEQRLEAPKIPGKDEDIVGNLDGRLAQAEAKAKAFDEWQARQQEDQQRQQNMQGFRGAVAQHEETFRATAPDYDDATQFLRASRDEELQDVGYNDPALRKQIIDGEAIALADQAMRQGKSPAEGFYKMAVRRGYKKAAPITAEQRANTIRQGQKAGQSLAGAGGGGTAKMPSPEAILAMSDEDFDKLTGKDWEKAFGVARR